MAQLISKQFRAALNYLLAQEGRGAQARLSNQKKIDKGYLNSIIKGRKPGAEAIRVKIAEHFDMAYPDMLILGRRILEETEEGREGKNAREETAPSKDFKTTEPGKDIVDLMPPAREEEVPSKNLDKMIKAIKLLESDGNYGEFLAGLIDALHGASRANEENLTLRNRVSELEAQIAGIQKRLDNEEGYTQKIA